jgi:hypothetical protein
MTGRQDLAVSLDDNIFGSRGCTKGPDGTHTVAAEARIEPAVLPEPDDREHGVRALHPASSHHDLAVLVYR